MRKLKKGDTVIITAGKDKGKKGKIEKIVGGDKKILLPGLNKYKRHMKKRDEQHPGGIIDISKPLSVSAVALFCPKCNLPTRAGFIMKKEKKVRICRKCKAEI